MKEYFEYISKYPSAWTGHFSFATKLVEEFKPDTIVDLGVDYGFSTFCFAYPKIGTVYGIDWFEGDEHAGIRNTYDIVIKQYEYLKDEFNTNNIKFIKSDFNELAKKWNIKIDILHIDGFHTYESVKNDYNTWSKFTDDRSIILFHDIECFSNDVGKFFDELDGYKFKLTGSCGLGVYTKDAHISDKIKMIINK